MINKSTTSCNLSLLPISIKSGFEPKSGASIKIVPSPTFNPLDLHI